MIEVLDSSLNGVKIIKPSVFEDFRGQYIETFNKEDYEKAGIDIDFIQDDISVSHHKVLRGIHGDSETWKLVSCHFGSFYLVVLNNDPESDQYLKWDSFTLSDKNRLQVLIPPKFGNGHLVLSEMAIFHYKQSTYYNQKGQFTYVWNDPKVNIRWPINDPILSLRDETGFIS